MRLTLPLVLSVSVSLACDAGDKPPPEAAGAKTTKDEAADSAKAAADDAEGEGEQAKAEPPAPTCPKADGERVSLMTEDSVELIADHYSPGVVDAPGVVLLHMIPPHHDLDNYPPSFIDPLVAAGFQVINVNRRGAPGSKGIPEQAYEGDKGKLDALAGVRFLLDSPCGLDANKLAVVGASNGTTSMVDYAAHAHATNDPKTPPPAAMIFLSGGGYTEKQTTLAEHVQTLGATPGFFAYPAKEAEWNDKTAALAKDKGLAKWSFHVFEPGAHGSKLFKTDPGLSKTLVDWLGEL